MVRVLGFFFSSRRRHTRYIGDWSSDVCSSDLLNEGLNVIEAAGYEIQGEVVILKEQLDPERAVVTLRADEEKVGIIADPLRVQRLKTGDHLLMDAKSGYLLEKLPKSDVEDLTLEEVPPIGYDDIGGLGDQIDAI